MVKNHWTQTKLPYYVYGIALSLTSLVLSWYVEHKTYISISCLLILSSCWACMSYSNALITEWEQREQHLMATIAHLEQEKMVCGDTMHEDI